MNADDYYNSDDARGVSPGFKPIPLTSTPKTTKPDSQSQTDASTLVSSESASGPGARARARLKRRKNPGEAILLHFFAPNHPELQSGKRCDCIEPCNHNESGSDSPTDPPSSPRVVVKQEMTASIEEDPDDASSPRNGRSRRGSPKASLVRRAQGAAQVAKSAVLSPFFRSKRESGSSDEEIEGASSRRGSRSRTRAKLERKRSSQQNHATISSFDHPLKRPRTAENGVRSTDSVEMLSPTSSDASVGLSDTLRPLMILNERRADTLAPLSAHSPADAPSPVDGFRLPSVAMDLVRETSSMGRSRASSSVSVSTMNSTPRPTPHHMGYGPIPCNDNTSTPLSAGAMSSASSYFTEHSRRTPRSNPPPRLHKYASSTHSVGSLTSVPELTPHATTSSNGDTPSDMATPPSRPPVERPRRREVSPPPMPANYIQVEHPIPGYKCTHDGCDAPPFPTPYTLRYAPCLGNMAFSFSTLLTRF